MAAPSPSLSAALEERPSRLERVALAIAADQVVGLETERWCRQLDELAAPLADRASPPANLEALCAHMYSRLGFHGCDDYDDPRCHLLQFVLERRQGSPVLLAVVLIALGQRVGVPIEPVGFPGHFLARAAGPPPVLVDPFDGRHPLPPGPLAALAHETLGGREAEARRRLDAVGPRTVAVRILENLLRCHSRQSDHARALVVCDRLVEMTAGPFHRCDRGVHALALGATALAEADFTAYLEACPQAPDADRVRALLERLRHIARSRPS